MYFNFSEAKKRFLLHVRFCNDKGRRSWATTIENYFGKSALLSKYPNYLVSINSIYIKFYIVKRKKCF